MGTPEMPPEAQRWLERVIDRISAMARAHELFSAGGEVRLRELITTTLDSVAAVKPEHVQVSIDLAADSGYVVLPTELAVPLAMVVYELAYNALVHGAGEAGQLRVRASRRSADAGGGELLIEIIDDGGRSAELVGAGVAAVAAGRGGAGLRRGGVGLSLVRGLVSRELRGSFTLDNSPDGGTVAAVSIPLAESGQGVRS
jgi:two-component sensor histidine kinase